ncbi:MAG: dethiobiotin synthase [Pseudohongiellaceae bacterium]
MSERRAFFITGTDTEVGKTTVTLALLAAARTKSLRTVALKPVAAGCEFIAGRRSNADARLLQQAATCKLDYEQVNPVALAEPIAPHLAAERESRVLSVDELIAAIRPVYDKQWNLLLIEGAGGWLVPLNKTETLADLARVLELPVILVVAIRLGCLNHALLSAQSITANGLTLAGWVANCVDGDMLQAQANIDTLCQRLPAPCLGIIPYLSDGAGGNQADASPYLILEPLLSC